MYGMPATWDVDYIRRYVNECLASFELGWIRRRLEQRDKLLPRRREQMHVVCVREFVQHTMLLAILLNTAEKRLNRDGRGRARRRREFH